jgi:hypothetical protein
MKSRPIKVVNQNLTKLRNVSLSGCVLKTRNVVRRSLPWEDFRVTMEICSPLALGGSNSVRVKALKSWRLGGTYPGCAAAAT